MPKWRFACPYGHRGIRLYVTTFNCEACRLQGRDASYPKDELVDLAAGEVPPHG